MDLTIAGRYMVYARSARASACPAPGREGARAAAQGGGEAGAQGCRRDHPHRRSGAKRADLERELIYLFKLGEVLTKRVAETQAPRSSSRRRISPSRGPRHLLGRLRARGRRRSKQHHRLVSFFSRTAPELVEHVELWEEETPLFEAFGVEQVLDSTLSRRWTCPAAAT